MDQQEHELQVASWGETVLSSAERVPTTVATNVDYSFHIRKESPPEEVDALKPATRAETVLHFEPLLATPAGVGSDLVLPFQDIGVEQEPRQASDWDSETPRHAWKALPYRKISIQNEVKAEQTDGLRHAGPDHGNEGINDIRYETHAKLRQPRVPIKRLHPSTPADRAPNRARCTCDTCGTSFVRYSDLDRHIEAQHGGRTFYRCLTCGYEQNRKDKMMEHCRRRLHWRHLHDGRDHGFIPIARDEPKSRAQYEGTTCEPAQASAQSTSTVVTGGGGSKITQSSSTCTEEDQAMTGTSAALLNASSHDIRAPQNDRRMSEVGSETLQSTNVYTEDCQSTPQPQRDHLSEWYSGNWNWMEQALAFDDMIDAELTSKFNSSPASVHAPAKKPDLAKEATAAADVRRVVVCPSINDIPPGKAPGYILKCGVSGCTSTKLFDRKYELQRHMETHDQGSFPCTVAGCKRGHVQPFKRLEHLRNHLKKIHGLQDSA